MSVHRWNAVGQLFLGTVRCTLQECTPFMAPSSFTNRCKMSAQAVLEGTGKDIINRKLPPGTSAIKCRYVQITEQTDWEDVVNKNPWLQTEKLVVKPDQLIKRRGKLGLMKMQADLDTVKQWVAERMNKDQQVEQTTGKLRRFIIEPFVPHKQEEETYVCIYSHRKADTILFHHEGGVNVGDVDTKALKLDVPVGDEVPAKSALIEKLLVNVANDKKETVAKFVGSLYQLYVNLYFTYLEINPLVVKDDGIYLLDLAAKLDSTAGFICKSDWGEIEFPPPFGRDALPEEAYIAELDAKTGASLKLTILNPAGRIWTMVAGGGASVVYSDTICDLGAASELANYGEYSGNPSQQMTYDYAKTILSLMTKEKRKEGKILIIGGGIANFTNVAATFKGIIRALQEFQPKLVEFNIQIFVRRGGPNYQEGLRMMRELGKSLGIPLHVFGPETHMTAICSMALGKQPIPDPESQEFSTAVCLQTSGGDEEPATSPKSDVSSCCSSSTEQSALETWDSVDGSAKNQLFSNKTRAIIWGMQINAVQSMLDFDFICRRTEPSVAAIVYPFTADHKRKFLWGRKEILIPAYKRTKDAMTKHPDVDVVVTFASLRSAYDSTIEAMQFPQIRTITIIAEGIPENMTRKLILMADQKGVTIIGPATVGGIKPGCFKIGNTGGMMDNILDSKLYRPGSVAYVSRSGGMSNELNNIVSKASNGVFKGVAIGGDRYPGSTYMNHLIRCEENPDVKLIVLLGEVGGVEEYEVCEALKSKKITKPMIAWCIGTCATMFQTEVQFGHAGAVAHSTLETAAAKNTALKAAGAAVPDNFDTFHELMKTTYEKLVKDGTVVPKPDVPPPNVPMDYSWARELGLIRKPSSFITTISDERGQELLYAGKPVSEVIEEKLGIGGVVSLLWFKQLLPPVYCDFFEMCLMLTADHGPAVSGALNTIVCARAGKDLISSLVSGLLTIGERFGGALDGAARMFSVAYDAGLQPQEFVDDTRKKEKLIMGIGHRVKSVNNPDVRVKLIKEYVMENFTSYPLMEYALEVEKITTSKKANLILNVDGIIGVVFVDMLRNSGCFTKEEAQEYIDIGAINGFFVLGRSLGFIGHFMDQKRLKQALYRHPWDDIAYMLPEQSK